MTAEPLSFCRIACQELGARWRLSRREPRCAGLGGYWGTGPFSAYSHCGGRPLWGCEGFGTGRRRGAKGRQGYGLSNGHRSLDGLRRFGGGTFGHRDGDCLRGLGSSGRAFTGVPRGRPRRATRRGGARASLGRAGAIRGFDGRATLKRPTCFGAEDFLTLSTVKGPFRAEGCSTKNEVARGLSLAFCITLCPCGCFDAVFSGQGRPRSSASPCGLGLTVGYGRAEHALRLGLRRSATADRSAGPFSIFCGSGSISAALRAFQGPLGSPVGLGCLRPYDAVGDGYRRASRGASPTRCEPQGLRSRAFRGCGAAGGLCDSYDRGRLGKGPRFCRSRSRPKLARRARRWAVASVRVGLGLASGTASRGLAIRRPSRCLFCRGPFGRRPCGSGDLGGTPDRKGK